MKFKQNNIAQFLKHIAGQKFTWFASVTVFLVISAFNTRPENQEDLYTAPTESELSASEEGLPVSLEADNFTAAPARKELPEARPVPAEMPLAAGNALAAKKPGKASNKQTLQLIDYAQGLLGTPYNYGGTSLSGFDCSGFVYHVFSRFDIDIERSSRSQSTQGNEVAAEAVQQGDLLFFTGTNPKIREVGHVGIVISAPGDPVSFVHSSSNGGVKISELEGYYNTRFMFAKRVQ